MLLRSCRGSATVHSKIQASNASARISVRCFGKIICVKDRQLENTCTFMMPTCVNRSQLLALRKGLVPDELG